MRKLIGLGPIRRLPNAFRLLRLNIVLAAVNFVVSIMLARGLGPAARGQLAILVMWISITAYLSLCGTHLFLARKVAAQPDAASVVYARAGTIIGIALAPSMIVFGLIAFVVTEFSASEIAPIGWAIAAAAVPFGVWNAMQMQIELGRNYLDTYITTQITFALGQAVIVGFLFLTRRRDPVEYISATLAASAFTCFVTHWIIRSNLPPINNTSSLPSPLRVIFAARKDALATLLLLLVGITDRLFVSLLFPAEVMGVYVVAIALSHLQNLVAEAVAPLFFARSSRDQGLAIQDFKALARRLRQSVVINIIAAFALFAAAPVLLPLIYGTQYSTGLGLVYFIVPAFAIKSAMRSYEEVLRGADHAVQQSVVSVAMLLIFTLSAAAAARLGWLEGIALSLLLSSIVGLFLVTRVVAAKTGLSVRELLLPRFNDAIDLFGEVMFHVRGALGGR